LSLKMRETGEPAGEDVIRKIVKQAGYRWRKARVVLTSNDPEFSQKLHHVQSILFSLKSDEAFFSIDEYGPFAIKAQPGRALTGPNEQTKRTYLPLILNAFFSLAPEKRTSWWQWKLRK
jgi:hypothetical protein